ncbi:MAG: sulfotransferase [Phycisphaerae bacterium]|nr:sulfotransferase [Phycisphaerae bacterium]
MSESGQTDPIFILGVPRSGTTLLRMILDSHPDLFCGPEAPWIVGRGSGWPPTSLRDVATFLAGHRWGPVCGLHGVTEEFVYAEIARFVDRILFSAARAAGKQRWADKTPESIAYVPFLHRLFPNARFIWLIRDGRDVAISTAAAVWDHIVFQEKRIPNTFENALQRWVAWNDQFEQEAGNLVIPHWKLLYEDLVREPRRQLQPLFEFLGVSWDDRVLDPYASEHEVVHCPTVEGERSFYARSRIDPSSLFRWKTDLSWLQRRRTRRMADATLVRLGYEPT